MFLENKYSLWYFNIVNQAKSRLLEENTYTENHHIIPKSLGGNNSIDNLVTLTAREHFICHILLTKMTTSQEKSKMVHAAIGMKRSRKYQKRYINSRLYEQVRKEFAIISSERNKGRVPSKETRQKMSKAGKGRIFTEEHKNNISRALKGKPKPPMSNELKKQISNKLKGRLSHRKGKTGEYKHTKEAKAKIAENNRTRGVSNETKAKISASVKAKSKKGKTWKLIDSKRVWLEK